MRGQQDWARKWRGMARRRILSHFLLLANPSYSVHSMTGCTKPSAGFSYPRIQLACLCLSAMSIPHFHCPSASVVLSFAVSNSQCQLLL